MSLINVTQRRQRKSLLGTHRRGRESMLPQLSDTLFSIYEEKRESRDSVEETVTYRKVEKEKSPELTRVVQRNETIRSSPVTHFEPVDHSDREDLSFRNERTFPIKRLDSFFSPPPNNDSFVDHETMLANDDSVLATSLADTSPEEENALADKFPEAEECHSVNDIVTASESEPHRDRLDSNTVEDGKVTVNNNFCDSTRSAFDQMIEFLDKKIWEREEFHCSCSKQIEELKKKLDESCKEMEDMRTMKQFLLTKLKVPEREDRENVDPDATTLTLPSRTESNKFVQEQEAKSQILCVKPPRQTRAPRASVLLTPHSMSLNVQNQYEKLLK